MKRYLLYMAIVLSIWIIPSGVEATTCDNRVLSDYRELASNINVYSNYNMVDGEPVFYITFTNIYEDMYIVDKTNNKTYRYKDFTTDTELTIDGFKEDQRLTFQVYVSVSGCYATLLTTKYVTLPNYNEYSTDPVCVGAEEYSLCQRWGSISGTYETFVASVEAYKEKKNTVTTVTENEKTLTWKEMLFQFVGKYYVYLVSTIILVILMLAALKSMSVKKNQFNFKV